MRKITKLAALLSGATAVAGVAVVTPSLVSAWGDNSENGARPSYTLEQINAGVLGDKVVLNSISNSVNGNEKNFVSAREYNGPNTEGKDYVWNTSDITVKDGQEYIIRLYVHNNNPKKENVAKDVHTYFQIPSASGKQVQVNGFVTSSNATPSKYWSYVNFNSNSDFHLEYVYGSALLENNGVGAKGLKLSDDVVTKKDGQQIGYYDYRTNPGDPVVLDGVIPGCYQFASYITIRVKAVFDTDFRVSQKVRLAGETEWKNYVNAKVGDKVEIQTEYKNTSRRSATHENVMMRAVLPADLKYVAGSTILYNGNFPEGAKPNHDNLTTTGVNIGNYELNANAYVRFTAEVTDTNLKCGNNTLVNWMRGTVNEIVLQDYASVIVNKVCADTEEPDEPGPVDPTDPTDPTDPEVPNHPEEDNPTTPDDKFPNDKPSDKPSNLPNTGAAEVAGTIIAAGSLTTAAGYYVASRRALR